MAKSSSYLYYYLYSSSPLGWAYLGEGAVPVIWRSLVQMLLLVVWFHLRARSCFLKHRSATQVYTFFRADRRKGINTGKARWLSYFCTFPSLPLMYLVLIGSTVSFNCLYFCLTLNDKIKTTIINEKRQELPSSYPSRLWQSQHRKPHTGTYSVWVDLKM